MSLGRIGSRAVIVGIGVLTSLALMAGSASAATLTVCESGPPQCGYSHIQSAVNAAASGDEISIAAGTYTEGLVIGKNLTLQGAGRPELTVVNLGSGNVAAVLEPASVTIIGLTIANGLGMENHGALTMNNCVVKNSTVFGGGAGMINFGTLSVSNSVFTENSSTHGSGGAIFNAGGSLTVANSTISHNSAVDGGGIWTEGGTLQVNNSTISNNTASLQGGGIDADTVKLKSTTISKNEAKEGGGIYNRKLVTGNGATITGNIASIGAGIFNAPGAKEELKHSTVQP
jgi:predicted outer membrane repeat protein